MTAGTRVVIPGTFPHLKAMGLSALACVAVVAIGLWLTFGERLGPDYAWVGLLSTVTMILTSLMTGIWDRGDTLLVGYGFHFRRVHKDEVVGIEYQRTELSPFRKSVTLVLSSGGSVAVPGLRNRDEDAETMQILAALLPAYRSESRALRPPGVERLLRVWPAPTVGRALGA